MEHLSFILQCLISGVTVGSIYSIVALGFSFIFNASGVCNFAQGEFVMLGGMGMIWLLSVGAPLPVAFLLSIVIGIVAGILLERGVINPRREAGFLILFALTLAASTFFKGVARLLWGVHEYSGREFSHRVYHFAEASLSGQALWIIGGSAFVFVIIWLFLTKTLLGKAMRANTDNRTGASLVGINTQLITLLSFAISAALGAIAGALVAPITLMSYQAGGQFLFRGYVAAGVGGFGSNLGALAAGYMLGIVEQLSAGMISPLFKDGVSFALVIILLTFKPLGLFGKKDT
jgi:branched-chain amino acid transport system permease protein